MPKDIQRRQTHHRAAVFDACAITSQSVLNVRAVSRTASHCPDRLTAALGLYMAQWWEPMRATYLRRISKAGGDDGARSGRLFRAYLVPLGPSWLTTSGTEAGRQRRSFVTSTVPGSIVKVEATWTKARATSRAEAGVSCKVGGRGKVADTDDPPGKQHEAIIKEIVALERSYFFEKRNVKTERQRKLREIIERHTKSGGAGDDS